VAKVESVAAAQRSVLHPFGDKKPISPRGLPSALADFERLRFPDNTLPASLGMNYAGGKFIRDSAQASTHTLAFRPEIAEATIKLAVELQGIEDNPVSEEARGKSAHEHRDEGIIRALKSRLDRKTRKHSEKILLELSEKWGGDGKSVTYYGAADTTPAIAILIGDYHRMYPERDVLSTPVVRKDGHETTVGESFFESLGHITRELKKSDLGLLEYQYQNPKGIHNQYFKDSSTSLIFADSEKHPNFKAPIAEIGIQGITYDALEAGKQLLTPEQMQQLVSVEDLREMFAKPEIWGSFKPNEDDHLLQEVENGEKTTFDVLQKIIQRQVLSRFWMNDSHYFASALDRDPSDPTGQTVRVVDGIASNPAALLNTGIFDDLSADARARFVGGIAIMITGPEFLTEAGHRGRALRHKDSLEYDGKILDDYHGVFVVWPNEVYNTAKGLERQGLYSAADQLKVRHTNAFNIAGSHNEFHLVDEAGHLQVHKLKEKPRRPQEGITYTLFNNSNHTEDTQAWGVTSNLALKRERGRRFSAPDMSTLAEWQVSLDTILIEGMQRRGKMQVLYKTREEIERARQSGGVYHTAANEGKRLDSEIRRSWDCEPWEVVSASRKSDTMKVSP